jgi:hypothetical protein
MSDDFIGFLTRRLQSYQLCPSDDGEWVGVILEIGGERLTTAIPHESLARLSREIDAAARLCADRRRRRGPSS